MGGARYYRLYVKRICVEGSQVFNRENNMHTENKTIKLIKSTRNSFIAVVDRPYMFNHGAVSESTDGQLREQHTHINFKGNCFDFVYRYRDGYQECFLSGIKYAIKEARYRLYAERRTQP